MTTGLVPCPGCGKRIYELRDSQGEVRSIYITQVEAYVMKDEPGSSLVATCDWCRERFTVDLSPVEVRCWRISDTSWMELLL